LFEVEFYKDKNGEEPIKEFIDALLRKAGTSKEDRTRVKKVLAYIGALEKWGTHAGYPYIKHIEGDIWELRPLRDRIFFFYWKDNTFVLVHHFFKKTQKTPKREIEQAKRNMLDHLERSEDNGK
jgi:phage-related protein